MALRIVAQHKRRTAKQAIKLQSKFRATAARSVCGKLERTLKVRVTQQHTAQSLAWCQHVRADGHACSRGMRAYAAQYKQGGWSRALCSLALLAGECEFPSGGPAA